MGQVLKNDKTKQIKQDGIVFTPPLPLIGGGEEEGIPSISCASFFFHLTFTPAAEGHGLCPWGSTFISFSCFHS